MRVRGADETCCVQEVRRRLLLAMPEERLPKDEIDSAEFHLRWQQALAAHAHLFILLLRDGRADVRSGTIIGKARKEEGDPRMV